MEQQYAPGPSPRHPFYDAICFRRNRLRRSQYAPNGSTAKAPVISVLVSGMEMSLVGKVTPTFNAEARSLRLWLVVILPFKAGIPPDAAVMAACQFVPAAAPFSVMYNEALHWAEKLPNARTTDRIKLLLFTRQGDIVPEFPLFCVKCQIKFIRMRKKTRLHCGQCNISSPHV